MTCDRPADPIAPATASTAALACPADVAFLTDLIDVQSAISAADPVPEIVMRTILAQAQRVCGGEGALFDSVTAEAITCRVAVGSLRTFEGHTVDREHSLTGLAVSRQQAMICYDAAGDPRVDQVGFAKTGTRSFIVVPLPLDGRIVGVLMVASTQPNAFRPLHTAGMQMIAGMLASKLAQAESFAANRRLLAERSDALDALRASEGRFRLLADTAPVGIFECDASGNTTFLNPRWLEMSGATLESSLGVGWVDNVHPDDRDRVIATWIAASQAGSAYSCEYRLCTRDGRATWVHAQATAVRDARGVVTGHIGTAVDITDRKRRGWLEIDRAEVLEMLARGEAMPAVLRRVSAGVARQIDKVRVAVAPVGDPAAVAEALSDAGVAAPLVEALRPRLPALLEAAAAGPDAPEVRAIDLFADPACRDLRVVATVHRARTLWLRTIRAADGGAMAIMICCLPEARPPAPAEAQTIVAASRMAALVMENREKSERIAHAATHDPLTALPNRLTYRDRLDQAIVAARRAGQCVGVVAIDVDAFKTINDTRGHATGDAVLKQFARRIREALRQSDTLARIGGDEFAAVLPGIADGAAGDIVGGKLVAALAEPFDVPGGPVRVTGSIGLSFFPRDGRDAESLLAAADEALYVVKSRGRNGWHARDPIHNAA